MAFENNQQDAFTLRNDTESLKQWQSELDKATTAIGAAEVAAEEELAALKFKNLTALQDARVAKLEQLIALEDKGIRELAKARLTLSDRQFELRKKEIQKEFQLAKNAAEELLKIKSKKTQTSTKKPASSPKDIATASKAKHTNNATTKKGYGKTVPTSGAKKIDNTKSATPEVIGLLSSIDETLTSLREVVTSYTQSKEENLSIVPQPEISGGTEIPNNNSAEIGAGEDLLGVLKAGVEALLLTTEQRFASIKAQYESASAATSIAEDVKEVLDRTTKASEATEPIVIDIKGTEPPVTPSSELASAIEAVVEIFNSQKPSTDTTIRLDEAKLGEELLGVIKSGVEALLTTTEQRLNNLKVSQTQDTKGPSVAEDIKSALAKTDGVDTHEQPTKSVVADDGGANKPPAHAEPIKPKAPESREFSDESAGLEKVKLGAASLNDLVKGLELNSKYLQSLGEVNPTLDLLNEIIAEAKADEKAASKAVEDKTAPSESKVSQTTLDLTDTWLKSIEAATEAEEELAAFKEDLERSTRLIALAQEQALREDLAETELKLIEDRAKAEATIAFNAAHRKDLLDQENQKVRLEYLAEYQKLQADGFSHLTENMTAEAFAALRAETEATEKAIAARSKANEAFDKAFAIQKGKGTRDEKKQLIDAIVKERAAEKDWSSTKYKITDDMSDDEKAAIQKKRETAVKAEMAVNKAMEKLANLAQQLNNQTDKIGAKQAPIDTRLQGSRVNERRDDSYWEQLARDMNKIGAVNPYFKQEDFASNIEALVNRGISFDIKQRAFLMTIQEKIANTFDVADGTLLRLVRIQQQDTTAGRLGMESALNSFLNSMYETSEYLSDVAASVRSSLGEMQALMEGADATELEFQVQKWMGSLYSVGMSQDAVQSIAQTFGQIASGDVSGLTGNGTGNLLIMAANEAGMSIADILQDGLDADETNKLMQAMVNYLAEIAETSSDSRVVQQQLANVYGIRASDLRAATNLASSIKDVSKQDLTYSGMLGQLNKMANSMNDRTSTGEMLSNVWDNVQYTMATQMANNPILYLLPRVATLLEDYAGGIDLPFVNVWGFGVDLNTSVAQLMNVAAMSGSILGSLGPMISGLTGALSGSMLLSNAGINTSGKAPVIARGSAQPLQHLGGSSISESGYIGNASGDDVKKATLQDAADSKKKQMVEAKDEESVDDVAAKANLAVVNIYNLLEEVAHGSQSLRVRVINNNSLAGGSAGGSGSSGGTGGVSYTIGDGSSVGATGAMGGGSLANSVNGGADNGNWVLSF